MEYFASNFRTFEPFLTRPKRKKKKTATTARNKSQIARRNDKHCDVSCYSRRLAKRSKANEIRKEETACRAHSTRTSDGVFSSLNCAQKVKVLWTYHTTCPPLEVKAPTRDEDTWKNRACSEQIAGKIIPSNGVQCQHVDITCYSHLLCEQQLHQWRRSPLPTWHALQQWASKQKEGTPEWGSHHCDTLHPWGPRASGTCAERHKRDWEWNSPENHQSSPKKNHTGNINALLWTVWLTDWQPASQTDKLTDKQACRQKNRHRQTDRQTDRQTGERATGQTGRQTGRQADRQTGRQADRQADRQTDRQTGRLTDRQTDRDTQTQTDGQIGEVYSHLASQLPRQNEGQTSKLKTKKRTKMK